MEELVDRRPAERAGGIFNVGRHLAKDFHDDERVTPDVGLCGDIARKLCCRTFLETGG
jgi:hypothetical protein